MGKMRIGKVLAAYPHLPLMALGLWLAWTYIAFSSGSWISSNDLNGIRVAQIYIAANATMAFVLLASRLAAARVNGLLARRRFALLGGIISSIGALAIIVAGPFVLGSFADISTTRRLFIAGCVVTGAGGAIVLLQVANLFGKLFPRNAIIELAYAVLVSLALYFTCVGVTVIPIRGNGPGIFQAAMFVALPFLAGYLASLAPANVDRNDPGEPVGGCTLPGAFWHMTIVVGVLAFSESIVEAYANFALPLTVTVDLFPFVQLFHGVVAFSFIAFAVMYDSARLSFGRIANTVMVISVLFIATASFAGAYNPMFYQILPFTMRVFEFVYMCMLFFIMFQRRTSSLMVFGASYGIFTACRTTGWAVGTVAFPLLEGSTYFLVLSFMLALLTLAAAFMLFSEKQFENLFEETGQDQTPLSDLLDRKLSPPTTTVASARGRFNIALDIVADEFDLTRREKDVLRQLAMGHEATRIAEELGIGWNTVRTHTRNVYTKLGVHSRQELSDLVDSYKDL